MVPPMPPASFGDTSPVSEATNARVTLLGHATILIEIDGARLLTDPLLRARVGPLTRLSGPPAREHWSDIDAVLISHSHWDHLDYGSLKMMGLDVPIVARTKMAGEFRRRGFTDITELDVGEDLEVGGVRIEAVHAEHKGFGPPVGGTELCLGFILHGTQQIYFAGDTAYFADMAEFDIGLDLALLPVWGWGPTAKPNDHLDPMGAARATAVIKPRIAVPIHWGTLHPVGFSWMRPSTRIDPPHQFAQLVRRMAPDTTVRVLPNGSSLVVPSASRRSVPRDSRNSRDSR
jgi:L-ascorbate metabolism protein UlaG (beta-lactamase superfamily)